MKRKFSYLPHTDTDIKEMLETIGATSLEELFSSIPGQILLKENLDLPEAVSELEIASQVKKLSQKNGTSISFLGAGSYDHFIPAVVNHLAGRSEFYTSYTPYQAEASQGILQVFFEYQSLMCELTGMDISNASLYDGGTSLTEGAILALNATKREKVVVSKTIHPEYREILFTYLGDRVKEILYCDGITDVQNLKENITEEIAAVIIQNPNFFGYLENMEEIEKITHAKGALLIVCIDPISLGVLSVPSEYKADIVVGEGQSLGSPPYFGGGTLGIFATRSEFTRLVPGRIVGETVDREGRRGYVLTLQTREQHIRREKATSNICTNQALMALRAAVFLSSLGKEGLYEMARLCLLKSHYLEERLNGSVTQKFKRHFFKEFVVECSFSPEEMNRRLIKEGITGGLPLGRFYPELKDCMLICVTEKRTREEMDYFIDYLKRHYG